MENHIDGKRPGLSPQTSRQYQQQSGEFHSLSIALFPWMPRSRWLSSIRVDISVTDAKNRLSELLRSVEEGERIVITRNGRPVAQLTQPPTGQRVVRFGTMRCQIAIKPGWDRSIDLDQFLAGEF
jgi:antitoxin (DNA-binding transcriptional repressor) of toxin-antitoxin stability system